MVSTLWLVSIAHHAVSIELLTLREEVLLCLAELLLSTFVIYSCHSFFCLIITCIFLLSESLFDHSNIVLIDSPTICLLVVDFKSRPASINIDSRC